MVKCNSKSLALQYTRKKGAEQESCCNSDIHLEMIIISVRLWKYKQRYVRNSTLKSDSCQTNERTSQNVLFNFPIKVCGTRWFWLGILANNSSKCVRCYCYERSLTFTWCFHYFCCCCCKRSKRRRFISILFSFRQHWFDITKPESGVFSHSFPKNNTICRFNPINFETRAPENTQEMNANESVVVCDISCYRVCVLCTICAGNMFILHTSIILSSHVLF